MDTALAPFDRLMQVCGLRDPIADDAGLRACLAVLHSPEAPLTLDSLTGHLRAICICPSRIRAPLICALSRRLPSLPVGHRGGAFHLLMDAVWILDVAHRGLVIQVFARRLLPLPRDAKCTAFRGLQVAAMAMPPAQARDILESLMRTLPILPISERWPALRTLIADVMSLDGDVQRHPLQSMSQAVASLPASDRDAAAQALLCTAPRLRQLQQGAHLVDHASACGA
jgi:hypothetical protein